MKRRELLKELNRIAKTAGAEMTTKEGANHLKVYFDGRWVTTVGRHNEINERTAQGALRDARNWRKP